MPKPVSDEQLRNWGAILCDKSKPLVLRFRALFGLRHASENLSIELIADAFTDSSALLKHEAAYCLGQKGNSKAIPYLIDVLEDDSQEVIVRHEAAEALGAIGDDSASQVLKKYEESPIQELSETSELALQRIEWLKCSGDSNNSENHFESVDPAPPFLNSTIDEMSKVLLDESLPIFKRYRAMFSLRDMSVGDGDEETKCKSVRAICEGLFCPKSALFRHEIAFVLGQLSHPESADALIRVLQNNDENAMVRHECAEALGSIGTLRCNEVLNEYLKHNERIIKESCVVALDMLDYAHSTDLQYALTP